MKVRRALSFASSEPFVQVPKCLILHKVRQSEDNAAPAVDVV